MLFNHSKVTLNMTNVKIKVKRGEEKPCESETMSWAEGSQGQLFCVPLCHQPTARLGPCLPPCGATRGGRRMSETWPLASRGHHMPKQTILWGQPPPGTPSPAPPLDPDPSPSPGHGLGGLTEGTPCFRSEDGHSQRAPTQEVSLSSHKKKGVPSPSVVCLGGRREADSAEAGLPSAGA